MHSEICPAAVSLNSCSLSSKAVSSLLLPFLPDPSLCFCFPFFSLHNSFSAARRFMLCCFIMESTWTCTCTCNNTSPTSLHHANLHTISRLPLLVCPHGEISQYAMFSFLHLFPRSVYKKNPTPFRKPPGPVSTPKTCGLRLYDQCTVQLGLQSEIGCLLDTT